eukprot:742341_1
MFMRIRTIFMWLVIYTSFDYNASNEVTEFRFKRYDDSTSYSSHSILITLWFGTTIYQVSAVAPGDAKTWLTFSMQNEPYLSVIGRNCSNITQAKIMFELDNPDSVCVDQVEIHTQSGDWYGIDRMYSWYENKFLDWLCIDNENAQYAPFKQIIYFDTMRPNIFIDNAAWSNGTTVNPQSHMYQCDPIEMTRLTAKHGTLGGALHHVLNQGRVYAMLNWGLESSKYLQIRGWESDWQMADTIYGTGTERSLCTSFSLSSDDYITGYHIWFDITGVSGLKLFTHNDLTFSCIGNNNSNTTSYSNTYDYGPYNFSYLTGWNVWAGSLIDRIQFQFTDSLFTAVPTQQESVSPSEIPTKVPSQNPTNLPTFNTNNPTKTPSYNPTMTPTYKTYHPSITPSHVPSLNPTYDPTTNPSTNPMYNITPSNIMETEITEWNDGSTSTREIILDSPPKRNDYAIYILIAIVSVLALCSICAVVGFLCYMKRHKISSGYQINTKVRKKRIASSGNDIDDCDVLSNVMKQSENDSKETQGAQNQTQNDVELQFEQTERTAPDGSNFGEHGEEQDAIRTVEGDAVWGEQGEAQDKDMNKRATNDMGLASATKEDTHDMIQRIVYKMDAAHDAIVIGDEVTTSS